MAKVKFEFTYDTTTGEFTVVNVETGETASATATVKKTRSTTKKAKKEESSEPQLTLLDGKYELNTAAMTLLGVEADARIAIKYKKINKQMTPVIGTQEAWGVQTGANRLTKSGTIACRGKAHDELAQYGTVFTLIPNADPVDTYVLRSDKSEVPGFNEDENIETPDEDIVNDIEQFTAVTEEESNAEELTADMFSDMLNSL